MNCSNATATTMTALALVFLATAAGFCIGAGIANGSFWGAPGAPALMASALGFTVAAGFAVGYARGGFRTFQRCVVEAIGAERCAAAFTSAGNALVAAIAAITLAALVVSAAIAVAWIPWGGAVPIGAALIAVGLAAAAVVFAVQRMATAASCARAG